MIFSAPCPSHIDDKKLFKATEALIKAEGYQIERLMQLFSMGYMLRFTIMHGQKKPSTC